MNAADYIVLLLVATLVSFALHMLRSRKKHGSGCCVGSTGGRNACSGCNMCSDHGDRTTGGTEEKPECHSCRKREE